MWDVCTETVLMLKVYSYYDIYSDYDIIVIITVPDISVWILLQRRNWCISKWWLGFVCWFYLPFHFQYLFYLFSFLIHYFCLLCGPQIQFVIFTVALLSITSFSILSPWSREVLSSVFKRENLKLKVRMFFSSQVLSERLKWKDQPFIWFFFFFLTFKSIGIEY